MEIHQIDTQNDVEQLHMLWVDFAEEVSGYIDRYSLDQNYHQVLGNRAHDWINNDEKVAFGLYDNHLKGFVATEKRDGLNPVFDVSNSVHVDTLFISEDYRERGNGRRLINHVEEWAEKTLGAEFITLSVEVKNTSAHLFWDDLNYQTTLEKRIKKVGE